MNTKIVSVSSGPEYSLALSDTGYLFGWGNLSFIDINMGKYYSPIQLGTRRYKTMSSGFNHIMAIDIYGILYGFGYNNKNQLGPFGTNSGTFMNDLLWESVSCGSEDTVAITRDGDMYTFGDNKYGQIGNNTSTPINTPHKIDKIDNSPWKKALCGMKYKIALNEDGRLFVWGYAYNGLLSNNIYTSFKSSPTEISKNGKWKDIITGAYTILAINEYNNVYRWGYNTQGELGSILPFSWIERDIVLIKNLNGANIKKINSSFSANNFIVINNDNSLYSWGFNIGSSLVDTTNIFNPTKINNPTPINWIDVVGSIYHSLAVDIDGNVYTYGFNNMGQLGIGYKDTIHNTFQKIVIPSTILAPDDNIPPPVDNTTESPSDNNIPAPIPTTTPIESSSNKKKIIIITVSVISSILFVILLLALFYKLNIKYNWITRN